MKKNFKILVILGFFAFLISFTPYSRFKFSNTKAKPFIEFDIIKYKNPVTYRGEYNVLITWDENDCISKCDVFIPTPKVWDSQENVSLISLKPNTTVLEDFEHNNTYLHYNKSDLRSISQRWGLDAKQTFLFTCYEIETNLTEVPITSYNINSSLYSLYTRHEKYLERDYFKTITADIVENETNPLIQARKIYDFVINHMKYQFIEGLGGAIFGYENGYGECGDYSALFCALTRAIGIPSRPVVGWWAKTQYGSYHVWAEFYLQDIGWIPVDPTLGETENRRNYFFGNLDNVRLIMSKGYNLNVEGGYTIDLLQVFSFWWWGSCSQPLFTSTYDSTVISEPIATSSSSITTSSDTNSTLDSTITSNGTSPGISLFLVVTNFATLITIRRISFRKKKQYLVSPI